MLNQVQKIFIYLIFIIFLLFCCQSQNKTYYMKGYDGLKVRYNKVGSQIEVGGPFVGIEMHDSSPLINRISFYYPVANSIDLSTDYWKRDQFRVLFFGLKVGEESKRWIGLDQWTYELTPYTVRFSKTFPDYDVHISYRFCQSEPAMVANIQVINKTIHTKHIEFYTHLETTIRTSHSYKFKNEAWTTYDSSYACVYTNFDDPETANASIFVANTADKPLRFSTASDKLGSPDSVNNCWINNRQFPDGQLLSKDKKGRSATSFVYEKNLREGETLEINQIIGSTNPEKSKELVKYLVNKYSFEVESFEKNVLDYTYNRSRFTTNDTILDHSVHWSKAILSTNRHYLDSAIVPMPCPAEYNFYFTHDVLLTDLAVLYFDIDRVKNDLEYIFSHKNNEGKIPHAYYWKDDRYVTEYAAADNWNNFWFVILTARYLRHTNDVAFIAKLFPTIKQCLYLTFKNLKEDNLMWATQPDWWDIGKNYGPRAYMTILQLQAIKEYLYIASNLNLEMDELMNLENKTKQMQQGLLDILWNNNANYILNYYADGTLDKHFYTGSLLAGHFDLLDQHRLKRMIHSASTNLLDENIGIYNVYPMDFHLLKDYLEFSGNEAGDPFVYANGGIWPHGNAWYALLLIADKRWDDAYQFIKKIMTIKGILDSPNGQPAMYEYRNSNYTDSLQYGKIDKPQFMWAGGWYLYCLYNLFGATENTWNIYFIPSQVKTEETVYFTMSIYGKPILVKITGQGNYFKEIRIDSKSLPSAVIPSDINITNEISIVKGMPELPQLTAANSKLLSWQYNSDVRKLTLVFKAFTGHESNFEIISPYLCEDINVGSKKINLPEVTESIAGMYLIKHNFRHTQPIDTVEVRFTNPNLSK